MLGEVWCCCCILEGRQLWLLLLVSLLYASTADGVGDADHVKFMSSIKSLAIFPLCCVSTTEGALIAIGFVTVLLALLCLVAFKGVGRLRSGRKPTLSYPTGVQLAIT